MKNRVVYGSRDLTAKQLANVLAKRCTKELPHEGVIQGVRPGKINGQHYAVSRVGSGRDEGSYTFTILREVWLTKREAEAFCERRRQPSKWAEPGWHRDWTANITVSKSLDIDLEDMLGDADLEALERTMLACALRGRDR